MNAILGLRICTRSNRCISAGCQRSLQSTSGRIVCHMGGGSTLGFCYMRTLVGEAMVGNTVPQPLRMKCLSSFTTACLANNSDKCSLDALTENAAKVLDRYNHPSLYQLDHPTSCPAECSHQDSIQIRYTCI